MARRDPETPERDISAAHGAVGGPDTARIAPREPASFMQGRDTMSATDRGEFQRLRRSRAGVAFVMFLSILIFFLVTEHGGSIPGAIPYVLLVGSAVMYFFMHGWGSHSDDRGRPASGADSHLSPASLRRSTPDRRSD